MRVITALKSAAFATALTLTFGLAGCASASTPDNFTPKPVPSDPPAAADTTPTPTEPAQPELSGIIAVRGATTTIGPATLEVLTIDPTSGSTSTYATFQSSPNGTAGPQIASDLIKDEGPTPDVVAARFSHDFTRTVAFISDPNSNLVNAGWLDNNGQFTDVTSSLYKQGQFADIPGYRDPMFGPQDTFYVAQYIGSSMDTGSAKLYGAAAGTTQPTLMNTPPTDYSPYWFWVSPNGTITPRSPGGYHYTEDVTPGVGTVRAESWVDGGSWLSVDSGGEQVWVDTTLLPQNQVDVTNWGTDGRAVTPKVSGFTVSSPVISSDKKTVAFIAHTSDGSHLYTVPLAGGQPQIVDTSDVDDTTVLAGWR